jgi:hypothetical protein
MAGQAPWQNGRRAWERLNGAHRLNPSPAQVTEHMSTWSLESLRDLALVRSLLGMAEVNVVRIARLNGHSWAVIAAHLGVSREEAIARWGDDAEVDADV